MNILEYENYHEKKSHVEPKFPYNTYLCTIPLDFTQVPIHWHDEIELIIIKKGCGMLYIDLKPHFVELGNIIMIFLGQLHSIHQIAEETGFENLSYFNRLFKQKYDVTPSAYRKIHEA